jgi:phosphatidylserine/phosphatidylglycerophosphate/cardiolipin synthase-like enzyme
VTRKVTSIADVPTSTLKALIERLESGHLKAPITRERLMGQGFQAQVDLLTRVLAGHSGPACLAILTSVLEERLGNRYPAPELVWTGPEGQNAQARDTAIVLRELFESARKRVILSGYSFLNAENVLEPLHRVMVQHGVDAHFFVNVEQPGAPPPSEEEYGRQRLAAFLKESWPFGAPFPTLYCDRRALRPGKGAEFCSLHAKCVTVDSRRAFISSANFTLRGQDRNIETGVLLDDARFAIQLDRQWMSLVEAGLVFQA